MINVNPRAAPAAGEFVPSWLQRVRQSDLLFLHSTETSSSAAETDRRQHPPADGAGGHVNTTARTANVRLTWNVP